MPGTNVSDASIPNLASGATLNAAGTTNGTIQELNSPGEVRVDLATSTVASTGNSATLSVEIQSSSSSTFASDITSHGRFAALSGTDAAQTSIHRYLNAFINKRYVRAVVVVGGTAPVYTGTTIKVQEEHYHEALSDSA